MTIQTVHVGKLLSDLHQKETIRARLEYGGIKAEITCIEGIIQDILPLGLFEYYGNKKDIKI